jgi:hypothetical protein
MVVKLTGSVGQDGHNDVEDVRTIKRLLRAAALTDEESTVDQALRSLRSLFEDDAVTDKRNAAKLVESIKRLQQCWKLKETGRIDKEGPTITALERTLAQRTLSIRPDAKCRKRIKKGGYSIAFSPAPPPVGYKVWLGVSDGRDDYIDITGCKPGDVMTADNLPGLLKLIEKHRKWGVKIDLKLFVARNGRVIESATSNPAQLMCPVQPLKGQALPLNVADWKDKYQGNSKKKPPFWGRWLQEVDGYEGHYFFATGYSVDKDGNPTEAALKELNSSFEVDNNFRGFDCITYAGTVCKTPPAHLVNPNKFITWCKSSMSAHECTCEVTTGASKGKPATKKTVALVDASRDTLLTYFAANATGYHIMWNAHHVVVVVDGTVHEFAESATGYNSTPVADWIKKRPEQSVVKLGQKPPRCT